jgi:hypothetical protein
MTETGENRGEGRLELTRAHHAALEVLAELVSAAQRVGGNGTLEVGSRQLMALMVTSASAVLSASLPDCPYSPAGVSTATGWTNDDPPRLVVKCSHMSVDGGPHCWNGVGDTTSCG